MDYKKIIKSRALRMKILRALTFIPDKPMIKLQYRIKTGRKLNLKNPKRYTEKLQWYKLYYKDPLMVQCVDKGDVREYVKSCGLEHILNECYGVFDTVEEIDFDKLPEQFVAKDTLGGGGNDIAIVKDKSNTDLDILKKLMQSWVSVPEHKHGSGRSWPYYSGKKHRIIIEKYLEQPNGDLPDYKFFCFNGKVFCFYIRADYAQHHESGKMSFYTRSNEWMQGVGFDYCSISDQAIKSDGNIAQLIQMAEKLSAVFPHARIDFYVVKDKIIFGEVTFFTASGYMNCIPDTFDFELGEKFILPKNEVTKDWQPNVENDSAAT